MPSGENTTADSMTKLHSVLAERMLKQSDAMATANWERGQRAAWGSSHREDDGGSEEMILVDSTVTITQHAPAPSNVRSGDVSLGHAQSTTSPTMPSPTKSGLGKLAKVGIAAALIASGGGAAVGVPMLIDTLTKPPTPAVQPATPTTQPQGSGVRFELGRDASG